MNQKLVSEVDNVLIKETNTRLFNGFFEFTLYWWNSIVKTCL